MRALPWLMALSTFALVATAHAEPPAHAAHLGANVDAAQPYEGPVDLNHADAAALESLPGIGTTRARAIIAYRSAHGGFRSLAQLLQVKGIGRALLKRLRPLVTLR